MPCGIQHRPASSQMLGKAALSLILLKNKWGIGNTSEACMQRLQGGSVPVIMLGGKPTSSLVMIRRCGLSQSPPCVWPLEAGPLYPTGQACHVLCSPFPRPWTTWGQWSSSSFIKELFNGFFLFYFFFLNIFSGLISLHFPYQGEKKNLFKGLSPIPGSHLCHYKDFFTWNVCIYPSCVHCSLTGMLLLLVGCLWEYVCTMVSIGCVCIYVYTHIYFYA